MNMLSISIGNDLVKRSSSLLFLVGLAVAAISVLTTARAASDLSGQYRMEGRGFGRDDDPYVGTCTLQNTGSAYDVSCFNSSTRHTYVGRGLVSGDTLAIYIGDRLHGDHNSEVLVEYLVVYSRHPDGTLEGDWLAVQGRASGHEILRPMR